MPRPGWFCLLTATIVASLSPARVSRADDRGATPDQILFFESKVRPILVEKCAGCHGPTKIKAGLRVDSRAALLAGGDTGPAVVPGKPAESHLVAAIRYEGPEMPPKGKLPAPQVEALTRWVEMGAPWPPGDSAPVAGEPAPSSSTIRKPGYAVTDADRSHWAFRPLHAPAIPAAPASTHPIDAFILEKLAARGLRPNPPASRLELIRRVTFDLTGLPPTPEEVTEFLADPDSDAYDRLVDRLLASPHYGEKWGRHWLDIVRFAETNSYERDGAKPNAWRYRDYVIRSFNDDKPYDRFIREQLAGDELPDGGPDGLIATGYYRLGLWDDEPVDREQAFYDGLDDIVATTGQVFLGLTVDCARCHDHKLDPIPQKDYYRFLAFFRNLNHYRNGGPTDEAPLFPSEAARSAYEQAKRENGRRRNQIQAELDPIENEFRAAYDVRRGSKNSPVDIEELTYRFYRDTFDHLPNFDSLKPEDVGNLPRGRFDLTPRTRNESFGFVFEGKLIVPRSGIYTFTLDSDDGSRLAVDGKTVAERDGVHGEGEEKLARVELSAGRVPIRLDYFQAGHGLGLTVTWSGPGFSRRVLSAPAAGEIASALKPLNPYELARAIRSEGVAILGEAKAVRHRELRRELEALKAQDKAAEQALVVTEAGPDAPATHVLLRGNPHSLGETVEPGFLQVVATESPVLRTPPPTARTTGRRAVLADWIASPTNPLTARVMANRVWQHHFGRGIVRSSNNLGTQGDKPTHPELLDWLASELVAGGWKLKPLHRLIVTSAAYRASSRPDDKSLAADPVNDLFWRFDMRRLTAEELRDAILSVSGDLNLKMYGPGVYPEIPEEVLAGQSRPGAGWGKSPPEEQARRSIYAHVKRSLIVPVLEAFDLAETDRSSPVRFATTQPTQALGMLNGSFLNRQARSLALRLKREVGDDPTKRIDRAFQLALGRLPEPVERNRALDLIAAFSGDPASSDRAWDAFSLVVLNLNEFLYLD
jgi:hypothetical protein